MWISIYCERVQTEQIEQYTYLRQTFTYIQVSFSLLRGLFQYNELYIYSSRYMHDLMALESNSGMAQSLFYYQGLGFNVVSQPHLGIVVQTL